MRKRIIPDKLFFAKVAEEIAKTINKTLKNNERASMVLSGGRTPQSLYEAIVGGKVAKDVDWTRVDFFFGDERDVSPMSEKSNFRMANEFFFKPLSIPKTQIFRWQTEIIEVSEVAVQYERTIRRYFKLKAGEFPSFDLLLLGLGDDCHTASLFPFSAALEETELLTFSNYVEKFDTFRLTMTFPVLNNASKIMFIVNGADKSEAVLDAFESEENIQKFPAQSIEPRNGSLFWFISESAGKDLAKAAKAA